MGNSSAAKILDEVFGKKNRLELIAVLKNFKKNKNRKNFESLLEFCLSLVFKLRFLAVFFV